eukprot:492146-Rhodomonas_salina.3
MHLSEALDDFIEREGRGRNSAGQWGPEAWKGKDVSADAMLKPVWYGDDEGAINRVSLKRLPMVNVPDHSKPATADACKNTRNNQQSNWIGRGPPDSSWIVEGGPERDRGAVAKDDVGSGVGLRAGLCPFSGKGAGAPGVSCRSWMVADATTGEPLMWYRPGESTMRLRLPPHPFKSWHVVISRPMQASRTLISAAMHALR